MYYSTMVYAYIYHVHVHVYVKYMYIQYICTYTVHVDRTFCRVHSG